MNPTPRPRVALVQSHWQGSPEENLKAVLRLVDRVEEPVHLICLPEFFLGAPWYFPGRNHLKAEIDQTIPGRMTDIFAEVAVRKSCYVICGTMVEIDEGRHFNTCAVIDETGRIVGKTRKIHRFSAEMLSIEAGDSQLLLDTPFGKIGICVCSDFWIVEMPRMLALQGAEIIAVPGAALRGNLGITRPCLQANSSFNVCYTLFAGGVGGVSGERGGRQVSIEVGGCSTIAGPESIIASCDDEETVISAELDLEYLRTMRTVDLSFRRSLYWCLHGRMPNLYKDVCNDYVGKSDLESLLKNYLAR